MAPTGADLLANTPAPTVSAPVGPSVAPPPGFVLDDAPPPAPPPGFKLDAPATGSGLWANIAQGAAEGIENSGALIRDALINPRAITDRAVNMAAQVFKENPAPSAPGLGALASMPADAAARKQSESVVAATPAERILRSTAAGATGGVINPENAVVTGAQLLAGMASGAGAGAAAEVAPDNLKPLAATIGGLAAPVAGHGAQALAAGAARVAEPLAAGVSSSAAEAAAARALASRATDPAVVSKTLANTRLPGERSLPHEDFADTLQTGQPAVAPDGRTFQVAANPDTGETELRVTDPGSTPQAISLGPNAKPEDAVQEALGQAFPTAPPVRPKAEMVAGSQPTTYQLTGDTGLGELEREAQTRNPGAFNQRRADQNAARVTALGDIQKGADPNDVSATLRQHFDDLDAAHEQAVNTAAQAAQEKAAQFGGNLSADQYGAIIRDAMQTGERGAAAHVGSFYDAIDPDGNLTGNLRETRQGAEQIAADVGPTSMPMTAEEADIFNKAASLPDIGPANQLIELRKYLNAVARKPDVAGTPTSARLTQLRQVIDSNLANTISQQIANEAPLVERGAIDPSQSTLAKVQSEVDAWRARRDAALARGDGAAPALGGMGAPAVSGVSGADGNTPEVAGARIGGGSPSPGVPTFDEQARQRLVAANQAARDKARVWGPKAIESILAKDGNGNFRVSDGAVAKAFFHPGPTGFEHMRQALKASPESLPALVDYAATTLRRAHMNEDGTLDPAGYARWKSQFADALRALPEDARAKFADAASATQTLADARAARVQALKAAQAGAIGRVMKLSETEDVSRTIGAILNSRTAVADMKQLAIATKDNPEARAGLRQGAADYMSKKLIGNTEAGTSGVSTIKGDAYQTFIKNARPALHLIFTPEEVRTMEAIGEDIQRSARSLNSKPAGTPGTAHDALAGMKKIATHGGKSALDMLGALVGEHHGGLIGATLGMGLTHLAQMLRGAGIARIDELVTQAMLHPHLAAALLKKAPPRLTDGALRSLTVALVKAVPATNAATHAH